MAAHVRARRLGFLAVALTLALPLVVTALACHEKASLVDRGGECFLATDCQAGLVCVDQGNGQRTCTDDLTEVAGNPPPDGSMPVEDAPSDAPQDRQPPRDSGQDQVNPPVDAGDDG